jgi:hypothetical protein
MPEIISKDTIDDELTGNGNVLKSEKIKIDKSQLLSDFLKKPVTERVKLKGRVIINRPLLNTDDVEKIGRDKSAVFSDKTGTCELNVGGQVLAKGKIVKKKGGYYFKITDLNSDKNGGKK